ncbi:MAG: T9SS type A sorting domain-containing protein [Cyclobacteriaceae bacterium]|nr:T9SS type A sorting domain-containing protein [Cyclobacteriaceae bacterium]
MKTFGSKVGKGNRLSLLLLFLIICFNFEAFSQASVVAGSVTTSKNAYAVGQGKNRLIVVAVTGEAGTIGTITSITWGGQALTQARTQVGTGGGGGNQLRTDIWYLNEAGISSARGACSYNFEVNWSTATGNEVFAAFTLKDVDQTTPVSAVNGGHTAVATTRTTGNVAVGVNDIMVYASSSNSNRTHTPPGTYTEQTDQIIGGAGGTSMATATREITTAGNENPTATWATGDSRLINVGVGFNGIAVTDIVTYYSRNATSGGHWDDPNSWTLNADGSGGPLPAGVWPTRSDNVVILAGHNITINATDDNKQCGVSPDALGRSNVGTFVSSNVAMFYQTGDIEIRGTLTVSGIEMMTEGYTHVQAGGSFILGSNLVNLGYLQADATSTLTCLDDLVLTGNSITLVNTNSTSTDDLIMDHRDATLCGTGTATLQNGAGSQVTYTNAATQSQICTTFTINCVGVGCSGFPVVGTGSGLAGNTGPGGVGQASTNSMWYMANFGAFTDVGVTPATHGQQIRQWNDRSGNNRHGFQATAANRPLFHNNAANGYPALRFTGDLFIDGPSPGIGSTSSYTYLIVFRDTVTGLGATNDGAGHFILDRTAVTNELVSLKPVTGSRYFYQKRNNAGGGLGGITGTTAINTNTKIIEMRRDYGVNYQMFYNNAQEGGNLADTDGATTPPGPRIGRHTNTANGGLRGYINEFIIYNYAINAAQTIIINNYLGAKYGLTLGANDLYTMDNPGNGNFDHEVAGIGKANDGSSHTNARGTGMVRMIIQSQPSLANNEFLFWGHNNATLTSNFADIGAPIVERLNRVWAVSETGDVGIVSVSFDISGLSGSPIGADLRLLIDRDGDGFADNDVTPIAGGTLSGGTITFNGVNFQNGDRFTLGNTNLSAPLPIELKSFHAEARKGMVHLFWTTVSETNNDYFTVERSKTGSDWESVLHVDGAGTTNKAKNYTAVDDGPHTGLSYYRLKQTDFDGTFTYSKVVPVIIEPSGNLEVYPNPSTGVFTVRAPFQFNRVQLVDQLGRRAHIHVETVNGFEATVDGRENIPGIYILQISDGQVIKNARIVIR